MFDRIKELVLGNAKNKKIFFTIGWVTVILIILLIAAGGSMTPDTDAVANAAEFNIGEMVFGTVIRLFLVLALIYGIFSIYRLFQKGSAKIYKRRIQVLDTHRFSAKQAVAILRIDGEELFVGLTDHQISLLKNLDTDISDGENGLMNTDSQNLSFQDILEKNNEQE